MSGKRSANDADTATPQTDFAGRAKTILAGVVDKEPAQQVAAGETLADEVRNLVSQVASPEVVNELARAFADLGGVLADGNAEGEDVGVEPEDVGSGLRFTHVVEMQTKQALRDLQAEVLALREILLQAGIADEGKLVQLKKRATEQIAQTSTADVLIALDPTADKYALTDAPIIDCEARIPLCKARCCTFTFALATQDLDEGLVRWDYGHPYQIGRRVDNYCVHNRANEPGKHLCEVWDNRPASCRKYDCRNDKRIWIDFDKRIPAK